MIHGPNAFTLRSVAGMLSHDGRCKTSNATADGFVRGEGVGALVIKDLAEADESRCRSLAQVRSAVMNQGGKSATLIAPSGFSQEEVLLLALHEAGLDQSAVHAIECHSTGTALGDPI